MGVAGVVVVAGVAFRLVVLVNRRFVSRVVLDIIVVIFLMNEFVVELELLLLLLCELMGNICLFIVMYLGCRFANRSASFSSCVSVSLFVVV